MRILNFKHPFNGFIHRPLWLGIVLLTLAGCTISPPPTPKTVTLQFWTLQLSGFADVLQPMIRRYEAAHPGVKIQWVDLPFSEAEKRVLASLLGPKAPDVINLNPDFAALLASRRAILDMNTAVAPAVKASYLPVAWQAVMLLQPGRAPVAAGLPWYLTSPVTMVNTRLLKQAGWARPPRRFAELPGFCRDVQAKTGAYGLMVPLAEGSTFLQWLAKADLGPWNAQGQPVFATRGAGAFLKMWSQLYQAGLIPAETVTESHRAAVDRYQSGSLALLLTGPNFLNIIRENAPDRFRETAVYPQFPEESRFTQVSTMLLAVPVRSQARQLALDFAQYVTNAPHQLALARRAPVLPSVTAALKDPMFQAGQHSVDPVERARWVSAQQVLKATETLPMVPDQARKLERLNFAVSQALLGEVSAEAAMRDAQAALSR